MIFVVAIIIYYQPLLSQQVINTKLLQILFLSNSTMAEINNLIHNQDSQLVSNLKKKRPNLTRLDIEKLFQQSVELTEIHRKLMEQNRRLKKDYQKVQQAKTQRQEFISQVERIVKEKSRQLAAKNPHQSSWLVFKLQQKIFDLKQEIQIRDKVIRKLNLSKDNQVLFRKEMQIECLREINQFAQSIGLTEVDEGEEAQVDEEELEEIVWMDDYIQTEKEKIQQFQGQLEHQERETKRLLTSIATRKADIKKMREIEHEYVTVQESFIQEKKKKEQKSVDNKSFLTNLMKERDLQVQKLQELKQKRTKIELQEQEAIKKLSQKLEALKQIYQRNCINHPNVRQKSDACIKPQKTEQWVKRVAIGEVEGIARNLNLCLALRKVDQQKWVSIFFKDQKSEYSIQQVIEKLKEYPFCMENEQERTLLARYIVEDNDTGLMLEDMNTSQASPIIKSILLKLIGFIKVYTLAEIAKFRQQLGATLSQFWSRIEQEINQKQGSSRKLVTREMLEYGAVAAELELTQQQLDYMVLFLFSWSRDAFKLEINKLGKLKELGIKFIDTQDQTAEK